MGYTVVVAEKPSVGRDIARVLGCRRSDGGALWGDGLVVTWAVGHLVTLCTPDELDEKYKKWRMEDLPILPVNIPLKVIPSSRKQFQLVKGLLTAKDTERIVCATDAGREGELIFRYIYEKSGCTHPVSRLWISSMTDEAIREGWAAMKPAQSYDGLYRSAQCRSQADWLVGMNASRAFTLRYDTLLSIGRVQTPTLAILVRRLKEIQNFQPTQYFTVTADFGDYQGIYFREGQENDTRIATREEAEIIAKVKGSTATVLSAQTKPEKELPPQLYDLTTLQREANKLLGFTAEKTLKLAQTLYETKKAITYPRTDSRHLPPDMIPRLKQTMEKLHASYTAFLPLVLREGQLSITKRTVDASKVTDHHAILPTPKTIAPEKLTPDEGQLYDLIARRTLAAFCLPYLYDATQVVTRADNHTFRSNGQVVTQLGWREIPPLAKPPKTRKAPSDEDKALPPLKEGDQRRVQKTKIKEESTKAPPHHTDASLLGAMEHAGKELEDETLAAMMKGSGIGTPATRAAIIQRIIQVGYAHRQAKSIVATDKGVQLIALMPESLASAETTGKWELALDQIAKGQGDDQQFMTGIRQLSAELVNAAKTSQTQSSFPPREDKGRRTRSKSSPAASLGVCPLCGQGEVLENRAAFYCSRYQQGCGLTLWKNALEHGQGPVLNDKIIRLLLEKKTVTGSTGRIDLDQGALSFTPKGGTAPTVRRSIQKGKS